MKLPQAMQDKIDFDMGLRLINGKPANPENDYERHLYARKLHLQGHSRDFIKGALLGLGLADVSPKARGRYIEDVLHSAIVGFDDNPEEAAMLAAQLK